MEHLPTRLNLSLRPDTVSLVARLNLEKRKVKKPLFLRWRRRGGLVDFPPLWRMLACVGQNRKNGLF